MTRTAQLAALPLLILAAAVSIARADDAAAADNWRPIFNSTNLAGWTPVNDGAFTVTNGALRVAGGKGWLRTEREFSDFILEAEWRGLETNFNSGIFIRAPLGKPWATNVWQINTKQSAVGELLQGSAKIVTVRTPPGTVNEWVRFRIEARGKNLSLDVDGRRAWEFAGLDSARGFIGIQAEGKTVEFRNVRVMELAPGSAR